MMEPSKVISYWIQAGQAYRLHLDILLMSRVQEHLLSMSFGSLFAACKAVARSSFPVRNMVHVTERLDDKAKSSIRS